MTVKKLTKEQKGHSMQILMVSNVYLPTVGGISTYIRDLSRTLIRNGEEVRIIAFPVKLSGAPRFVRWIFYLGFIVHVLFVAGILRLGGKTLVVHSHSASFCLVAAALCRKVLGCRAIHTFHSPMERPSPTLNCFVPKVDAVAYVADATRRLYHSHGVPEHPNEYLVAGGVDVEVFQPPVQRLSLCDGIVKILFVGRICEEKGVREAIMAINAMRYKCRLVIVGVAQNEVQKAYENELHTLVETTPALSESVVFCGGMNGTTLVEAFQSADVFVIPSICDEQAPMVIAEAFASGLPVIAFDTGGVNERVQNGIDGLIVPRGDVFALTTAFDSLVVNERLRWSLGASARERAVAEFSLEGMFEKYLRIYVS